MFKPLITLSRALTEPALFGNVFASPSFWTWRVVGRILDGLPLTEPREIELFEQCTGRRYDRQAVRAVRRLIALVGRRGGKDRFLSAVGVWRAALCTNWNEHISAGEQAVVILLGADKKQAAILRRYCNGLLQTPPLAAEVVRQTAEVIEFRNGASLEIITNDAGLVRGRSAIAVIGSECSHWRTDEHSSSSDEEVVGAALPSMAMCPDGGLLLMGSSVHKKRGFMYRQYRELHGNNDAEDICWFAPSNVMNPKLPQAVVDKAMAEDPHKAGAEYNGIWREDLSDCYPLDAIEASTDLNIYERPPQSDTSYVAFTDAAGGTGSDSFALAISHRASDQTAVLDVVRERKPRFVPRDVVAEYAKLLKSYGISEVRGDGFAGGFHSDEWRRNGITFRPSDNTTSENYLHLLPMLLSGRVRLINNATLRNQLANLERSVTGGKERVTHPAVASAHDDVATAAAGALVAAGRGHSYDRLYRGFMPDPVSATKTSSDFAVETLRSAIQSGYGWGAPAGRRWI
jgi:hypothetical protein